jgi:hypothetical protein
VSAVLLGVAPLAFLLWLFLRGQATVLPGEVVYRGEAGARTLVSQVATGSNPA